VKLSPFILWSELTKNEKFNYFNDLKNIDKIDLICHLFFVGGKQQPNAKRRRNANLGAIELEDIRRET